MNDSRLLSTKPFKKIDNGNKQMIKQSNASLLIAICLVVVFLLIVAALGFGYGQGYKDGYNAFFALDLANFNNNGVNK